MNLTNNLKSVASSFQQGVKTVSITFSQRVIRLVSGFFFGLVLSLIVQEFAQSGILMLVFFTTLFAVILYKLLRKLTIFQIFIFDVICILVVTLLRMYILIAP